MGWQGRQADPSPRFLRACPPSGRIAPPAAGACGWTTPTTGPSSRSPAARGWARRSAPATTRGCPPTPAPTRPPPPPPPPPRPGAEPRFALPKHEFGLDVIALVGALRYAEHRSVPEIHATLRKRDVGVSERTVTNLLDRYDELLAVALGDDRRLKKRLADQGRVILA